jgi:hypothetical protein
MTESAATTNYLTAKLLRVRIFRLLRREKMKRLILITFLMALPFSIGVAQESGKTLASTLEVFVFPSAGQAAD